MLVSVTEAVRDCITERTVALIGLNNEGIILDMLALAVIERGPAA